MKITGYKKSDTEIEGCMVMSDIGIASSAEELHALAKFLMRAADDLDLLGKDFDHLHLMDEWSMWKEYMPDIQILVEKYI